MQGALITIGSVLIPLGLVVAIIHALKYLERLSHQRPPFTRDLIRPAGFSRKQRIDELHFDLAMSLVLGMSVPVVVYSLWVSTQVVRQVQSGPVVALMYAGLGAAGTGWFLYRFSGLYQRLSQLRLRLDGEMATGEELDQLMLRGARIFHDVPGAGLHIDHVIVAETGVFAVETLAWQRLPGDRGLADGRAVYDGQAVNFPDGIDTESVAEAKRKARWLGEWLVRATADPVSVTPVVALPGWLIHREGAGVVVVLNPREAHRLLDGQRRLSPDQKEHVAIQLERLCREIAVLPRHREPLKLAGDR